MNRIFLFIIINIILFSSFCSAANSKKIKLENGSLEAEYVNLDKLYELKPNLDEIMKITIRPSCTEQSDVKALPDWISELKKLEELNLGSENEKTKKQECNLVTSLPLDLTKLKSLKKFIVNDALAMPENLGLQLLSMPNSLEIISLNRAELKSVPYWVFEQKHLKRLTLQYNQIEEIPDFLVKLNNLEELDLRHNKIKHFPGKLKSLLNLKRLYLSDNLLKIEDIQRIKLELAHIEIIHDNKSGGSFNLETHQGLQTQP